MEQLGADVMIGPLSGDEAVYDRELREVAPVEDVHHRHGRLAGSDPADRTRRTCSATTATAPSGTPAPADRLQEARLAQGSDHHGRLQLRLASGAGLIADFCAARRQDCEAGLPAAEHDGLRTYVAAVASPRSGRRHVLGHRWHRHRSQPEGVRAAYGKLDPKKHIGNLFFAFLGADKVVAPKVVGSYVGGFGTAPGLKSPQAKTYEKVVARWYPGLDGGNYADGFVYNYFNAAWAFVQGLTAPRARWEQRCRPRCPRRSGPAIRSPAMGS